MRKRLQYYREKDVSQSCHLLAPVISDLGYLIYKIKIFLFFQGSYGDQIIHTVTLYLYSTKQV